jgi:hypothetical protein
VIWEKPPQRFRCALIEEKLHRRPLQASARLRWA